MKKLIFFIIIVFSSKLAICNGLYTIPAYDGAHQWSHSIDQAIRQILSRVIRPLTPVRGEISSGFGKRFHPILKRASHHSGVDIACKKGSPVKSALSGKVVFAGEKGAYGKLVILSHQGMYDETRYGHLSKIIVKNGEYVSQGQLIGYSGMTGRATGPHLHFELYENGIPIDSSIFIKEKHDLN